MKLTEDASKQQWARWRAALAGARLDLGARGDPPSGYYHRGGEAIAVWRDKETGEVKCARSRYGDGSKLDVDQIDELFADPNMVAIHYSLYATAAAEKDAFIWPEIYSVKIATKDIKAGLWWTPAYAKKKLAEAKVTNNFSPARGIGDNRAPAPEEELAAKIAAKAEELAKTLKDWGGTPRNAAEADLVGAYANAFKEFEKAATEAHKVEKEPHLAAGRAVDAKWFAPVRDKAIAYRERVLKIVSDWTKGEDKRRAEEAARVNAEARARAEQAAKIEGTAPAPVEEIIPEKTKVTTLRGRAPKTEDWVCTDPAKAFAYFAAFPDGLPLDVRDAIAKTGRKICLANKKAIPGFEWKELS